MHFAYAAADIVISRAGAIAIAEICLLKKASILIPSPHVSENHQYENAKSLADNSATCLIKQKSLDKLFWEKLKYLIHNELFRTNMSENAFSFGHNNAEQIIVDEVIKLLEPEVL